MRTTGTKREREGEAQVPHSIKAYSPRQHIGVGGLMGRVSSGI